MKLTAKILENLIRENIEEELPPLDCSELFKATAKENGFNELESEEALYDALYDIPGSEISYDEINPNKVILYGVPVAEAYASAGKALANCIRNVYPEGKTQPSNLFAIISDTRLFDLLRNDPINFPHQLEVKCFIDIASVEKFDEIKTSLYSRTSNFPGLNMPNFFYYDREEKAAVFSWKFKTFWGSIKEIK